MIIGSVLPDRRYAPDGHLKLSIHDGEIVTGISETGDSHQWRSYVCLRCAHKRDIRGRVFEWGHMFTQREQVLF